MQQQKRRHGLSWKRFICPLAFQRFRPFRVHEAVWQGRAEAIHGPDGEGEVCMGALPPFHAILIWNGIYRAPDGSRFASRTG
jgi:hypothetical protein